MYSIIIPLLRAGAGYRLPVVILLLHDKLFFKRPYVLAHTKTNPAARRGSSAGDEVFLRRYLIGLVPNTYGGVFAAAATAHSLLLYAAEEVLTTNPSYQKSPMPDGVGTLT
jgi:hypothetical protein